MSKWDIRMPKLLSAPQLVTVGMCLQHLISSPTPAMPLLW